MRSPKGFVASGLLLLALPVAIASQIVSDGAAEFVIHAFVGVGCLFLAAAAFDFGVPASFAWVGRLSAGAFGSIFVLQAISQLVPSEALRWIAFDVLGQQVEKVLPYLALSWFVAVLAIGSSRGWTRVLGATIASVVLASELLGAVGPALGVAYASSKVLFLLPFCWLILESFGGESHPGPQHVRAEASR